MINKNVKHVSVMLIVTTLSLALAACGQSGHATNRNQVSSSSQSSVTHSSHVASNTPAETTTWDSKKSQQLSSFFAAWGPVMQQNYKEYGPNNPVSFYGAKFPDEFNNNNMAVDDQPVSMEYSKDCQGNKDYEVVSIFSDAEDHEMQRSMSLHLYLLAIHNGKPVALVTEQNQGASDNRIHFSETKNTDVRDNFNSIFEGKGIVFQTK